MYTFGVEWGPIVKGLAFLLRKNIAGVTSFERMLYNTKIDQNIHIEVLRFRWSRNISR